jgi:charged multivesicular body protein 2A
MSKDLVRNRNQVSQYYMMGSQLKAISMKLGSAQSSAAMVEAMTGVTKVMTTVNDQMDVASIRESLKEFAKQSDKMEMQGEMVIVSYSFIL